MWLFDQAMKEDLSDVNIILQDIILDENVPQANPFTILRAARALAYGYLSNLSKGQVVPSMKPPAAVSGEDQQEDASLGAFIDDITSGKYPTAREVADLINGHPTTADLFDRVLTTTMHEYSDVINGVFYILRTVDQMSLGSESIE